MAEVLLAIIDQATLSVFTTEPAQDEVERIRVNALLATPGPDYQLVMVDKNGINRDHIFTVGQDINRPIPINQRGLFQVGPRTKPDTTIVDVLIKPEYRFSRLP